MTTSTLTRSPIRAAVAGIIIAIASVASHAAEITGAGSTFVYPILSKWSASYNAKKGTKIKSIRLVDGADGHNVDCKTDLGSMLLKSEFLKKA